ncbi:vitamin B12 dependent-methionine synthase activation domain-containing protein, partial [Acinetobacter baumannii]
KLYHDANALLDKIIAENWLTAKGVIGFWSAASHNDTVIVEAEGKKTTLAFLRQQIKKAPGQPNLSLADFIRPSELNKNTPDSRLIRQGGED